VSEKKIGNGTCIGKVEKEERTEKKTGGIREKKKK